MEFSLVGYSRLSLRASGSWQTPSFDNLDGADFALFKMLDGPVAPNSYVMPSSTSPKLAIDVIPVSRVISDMTSGPVFVICSQQDVRPGLLLEGSALFMNNTGVWETKKLYVEEPLGMSA